MNTYKILGLLLTYPEQVLLDNSHYMFDILKKEKILSTKNIKKLEDFFSYQQSTPLIEQQEYYIDTFDKGRAHCLHIFEHIHGESRDRGQAMINLNETYATKSLYIKNGELPDYLPLFMEFLSRCKKKEARDLLGEAIQVIGFIGNNLRQKKSVYSIIFKCIENLSVIKVDMNLFSKTDEGLSDEQNLEQLDKQWEEKPAFGTNAADCNMCNKEFITSNKSIIHS